MTQNTGKDKIISFCTKSLQILTAVYFFLLVTALPLYVRNGYVDIGIAKWDLFFAFTWALKSGNLYIPTLFPCMILLRLILLICDFQKPVLQKTDICVLLYLLFVCLSVPKSIAPEYAVFGFPGWYMGLLAQLSFVLIYYFASRYLTAKKYLFYALMIVSFFIFLFEILNRFYFDPFGWLSILAVYSKNIFVSTIGNINWFAAYMMLIYPISLYLFQYENSTKRILSGIHLFVSSAALITQDSSSAYAAFLAVMLFYLCRCLVSTKQIRRYMETLVLILVSWRFIGICRVLYPGKVAPMSSLSHYAMHSTLFMILTITAVILYILFNIWYARLEQMQLPYAKMKKTAVCISCSLPFLYILYVLLNSTGHLPPSLSSTSQFLEFNEYWGSGRGVNWITAVQSIFHQPFLRTIFGNGPETYSTFILQYYPDRIHAYFSDVLTNAHNEFLTILVNTGLPGMIAYISIFITTFRKNCHKNSAWACIICAVILAYCTNNFFSFQQILCTPLLFAFIGAAQSVYETERR